MIRLRADLIAMVLMLNGLGCAHVASASRPEQLGESDALPGVDVTFVRLAPSVDFGQQRMIEQEELHESQLPGDTPWFRLSNQSNVVIAIPTCSIYWRPLEEWDPVPGGKKVSLKDGMQVSI